jgi:hypothetical protein
MIDFGRKNCSPKCFHWAFYRSSDPAEFREVTLLMRTVFLIHKGETKDAQLEQQTLRES